MVSNLGMAIPFNVDAFGFPAIAVVLECVSFPSVLDTD